MNWAKAMCQGGGANVPLDSDKEDDGLDGNNRKVKFEIYSVKSHFSHYKIYLEIKKVQYSLDLFKKISSY